MGQKRFETNNKAIYILVDEESIQIKKRFFNDKGERDGQRKLWKIIAPSKESGIGNNPNPWCCVDWLAMKEEVHYGYNSHQNFIPADNPEKLAIELSKRVQAQIPLAVFECFEGKRMVAKLAEAK